jgi:hypothetical protein
MARRPPLHVVKTPATPEQALVHIKSLGDQMNATALARELGWSRAKLRRFLAAQQHKGLAPVSAAVPVATKIDTANIFTTSAPALQVPRGTRTGAILLASTALTLAGVGLLTNAQFAASLGQTPVASTLLAALGFAIDGLALILPCIAGVLWHGGHRLASVSAWAVWAGAVTMTLITAAGFAAGNIGDAVTGRAAKIVERTELTSRIETLKARHAVAIAAAERARAGECKKVGPVCRLRETALAAVLADPETDLEAATAALTALPPVVAGDPAGEMIAAWLDGAVSASTVHRVRIAGLTVLPGTAGLLLSFAWLAWRPGSPRLFKEQLIF